MAPPSVRAPWRRKRSPRGCSSPGGRRWSTPATFVLRSPRPTPTQGDAISSPAGTALSRARMSQPTDANRDPLDTALHRLTVELVVERVCLDAARPLHDVQGAEIRGQAKVASLLQIVDRSRG